MLWLRVVVSVTLSSVLGGPGTHGSIYIYSCTCTSMKWIFWKALYHCKNVMVFLTLAIVTSVSSLIYEVSVITLAA